MPTKTPTGPPLASLCELARGSVSQVVDAYLAGRDTKEEFGVDKELAEKYASCVLVVVSNQTQKVPDSFIDSVSSLLDDLDINDQDKEIAKHIYKGVSNNYLQDVFSISYRAVQKLRKKLNKPGDINVRKQSSDSAEIKRACTAWDRCEGISLPARYLYVNEATSIPLDVVRWIILLTGKRTDAHDKKAEDSEKQEVGSLRGSPYERTVADNYKEYVANRPDSEGQQTIIRIVMTYIFVVLAYFAAFNDSYFAQSGKSYLDLVLLPLLLSWIPFVQLIWIMLSPRVNTTRRFIGLVYDLSVLTWYLWGLAEWGAFTFFVYGLCVMGNGLRFGRLHLVVCIALTAGIAIATALYHPYWTQARVELTWYFVMVFVLPLYAYIAQTKSDRERINEINYNSIDLS